MKIVYTRSKIREVADRWKKQYFRTNKQGNSYWEMIAQYVFDEKGKRSVEASSSLIIYEQLLLLDPETATKSDVERIIGNNSWTQIRCDICEKNVTKAVIFCKDCVCSKCLERASEML